MLESKVILKFPWDYCLNCGNPYYERRESGYCHKCDKLLEEGKLEELRRIKGDYINKLLGITGGSWKGC